MDPLARADGDRREVATHRVDVRERLPRGSATPSTAVTKPIDGKLASPKRYEWGAPEDYQLLQAINQLKGKPVDVAKPKPDSVAVTTPAR